MKPTFRTGPQSLRQARGGHAAARALVAVATTAAVAALAQTSTAVPGAGATDSQLSYPMVFTAFMVMLGPLKLVGPFVKFTSDLDETGARKVGTKAFFVACIGGIVAAVAGQKTLVSWGISNSALYLAAGLVLLLVALKGVLAQYEPVADAGTPQSYPNLAFSPLAFPTILTPHGIATFILILAVSHDQQRDLAVIGIFFAVMTVNWVVMRYARAIMRRGGAGLAILGAVLSVLQVALAVQMIVTVLRLMHVLPAVGAAS